MDDNNIYNDIVPNDIMGVIVPGQSLITDFCSVDETKWVTNEPIYNPINIPEIFCFLNPNIIDSFPQDAGILIYYMLSTNDTIWELLGCIHIHKPSGVYRTNFTMNDELINSSYNQDVQMFIGVEITSLDICLNLSIEDSGVKERKKYALKIAQNLYNYMGSFATNTMNYQTGNNEEVLIIPTNVIDQWIQSFERKYDIDPNFIMK